MSFQPRHAFVQRYPQHYRAVAAAGNTVAAIASRRYEQCARSMRAVSRLDDGGGLRQRGIEIARHQRLRRGGANRSGTVAAMPSTTTCATMCGTPVRELR